MRFGNLLATINVVTMDTVATFTLPSSEYEPSAISNDGSLVLMKTNTSVIVCDMVQQLYTKLNALPTANFFFDDDNAIIQWTAVESMGRDKQVYGGLSRREGEFWDKHIVLQADKYSATSYVAPGIIHVYQREHYMKSASDTYTLRSSKKPGTILLEHAHAVVRFPSGHIAVVTDSTRLNGVGKWIRLYSSELQQQGPLVRLPIEHRFIVEAEVGTYIIAEDGVQYRWYAYSGQLEKRDVEWFPHNRRDSMHYAQNNILLFYSTLRGLQFYNLIEGKVENIFRLHGLPMQKISTSRHSNTIRSGNYFYDADIATGTLNAKTFWHPPTKGGAVYAKGTDRWYWYDSSAVYSTYSFSEKVQNVYYEQASGITDVCLNSNGSKMYTADIAGSVLERDMPIGSSLRRVLYTKPITGIQLYRAELSNNDSMLVLLLKRKDSVLIHTRSLSDTSQWKEINLGIASPAEQKTEILRYNALYVSHIQDYIVAAIANHQAVFSIGLDGVVRSIPTYGYVRGITTMNNDSVVVVLTLSGVIYTVNANTWTIIDTLLLEPLATSDGTIATIFDIMYDATSDLLYVSATSYSGMSVIFIEPRTKETFAREYEYSLVRFVRNSGGAFLFNYRSQYAHEGVRVQLPNFFTNSSQPFTNRIRDKELRFKIDNISNIVTSKDGSTFVYYDAVSSGGIVWSRGMETQILYPSMSGEAVHNVSTTANDEVCVTYGGGRSHY